jgi:deoxyribodipyrimidine photo-lyase
VDRGEWDRQSVSGLSPYISRRVITEEEVVGAVLDRHGLDAAEKYLQEVCWRTYWKGWLEQRPEVWRQYLGELKLEKERWSAEVSRRQRLQTAEEGKTSITAFNHWVAELKTHGYLHNHARMWFAGIWIYDLGLPWQLGADFFYRHLLDRDPASNTLSWRWVAGLQTQGKRYIPSAGNIEKFTDGRFDESDTLSCDVQGPEFSELPEREPLAFPSEPTELPATLLLHRDDLAMDLPAAWTNNLKRVVLLDLPSSFSVVDSAPHLQPFDRALLEDARVRWSSVAPCECLAYEEIPDWWARQGEGACAMPWSPVGPVRDALEALWQPSGRRPLPLLREWDRALWPLATAGFFSFWKKADKWLARR